VRVTVSMRSSMMSCGIPGIAADGEQAHRREVAIVLTGLDELIAAICCMMNWS